jgi:hypothetical protein
MKTLFAFCATWLLTLGLFSSLPLRGQSVLEVRFYPSFMFKSTLTIQQSTRGKNTLRLVYENQKDQTQTTEVKVPAKALDSLNSFLKTFIFRRKGLGDTTYLIEQIKPQDSTWVKPFLRSRQAVLIGKDSIKIRVLSGGTDGMSVDGSYESNEAKRTFRYWSPRSDTPEYQLDKLLYEVAIGFIRDSSAIKYIEDLSGFFNLGLGIRKTSENPLIWKFFGSFSVDEINTERLKLFFKTLPASNLCYIDLSNFQRMGTWYYPLFKSLIDEHPNVLLYRPTASAHKQLREMQIPIERIVERIPRLPRFKSGW